MELIKRALLLTVDSNVGDLRQEVEKMKGMTLSAEPGKKMGPFTEFTLTSHDPALNWEDLTWLKEVAGDVPIYMKGVSSIEVSESLVPDLTIRIFV
jgi:L-lactate dehydrogenase (cytochrome)